MTTMEPGEADGAATAAGKDRRRLVAGLVAVAGTTACSPTVRVAPPDRPIEINLNVRIEQEVRIRIDRELEQIFEENDEIF